MECCLQGCNGLDTCTKSHPMWRIPPSWMRCAKLFGLPPNSCPVPVWVLSGDPCFPAFWKPSAVVGLLKLPEKDWSNHQSSQIHRRSLNMYKWRTSLSVVLINSFMVSLYISMADLVIYAGPPCGCQELILWPVRLANWKSGMVLLLLHRFGMNGSIDCPEYMVEPEDPKQT